MPPKESKELKAEIAYVINNVRSLWPDFVISSEDLTNPTAQFVARFYTSVAAELNDKLSYLLDEEAAAAPPDPVEASKDFDGEVQLFCTIWRMFSKIGVDAFCLNDIYRPVPKRTRFFARAALHFLIYVESNMQHCSGLTESVFKKVDERQKLHEEKQELLQEISESAENIVVMNEDREKLLTEKEVIVVEHRKILNIKHVKEKLYAEKQLQIEKITSECQNEEYQLKCLEEEEITLKEQMVTEEDFKDLKGMEGMLEKELEKLSDEDVVFDGQLGSRKEEMHIIQSCVDSLSKISLDTLSQKVDMLHQLEDQNKKRDNNSAGLAEQIKHLQEVVDRLKEDIKKLSDMVEHKEQLFEALSKDVNMEIKNMKHELEVQKNKTTSKLKKSEEMNRTIETLEDDISRTKTDREYFKQQFAVEYKKILDTERHVVNKVFRMFTQIRSLGEEAREVVSISTDKN